MISTPDELMGGTTKRIASQAVQELISVSFVSHAP